MTITFFAPDSPITGTEDRECYCTHDGIADTECLTCRGSGVETINITYVPELNLTNANANSLLEILNCNTEDYCGVWTVDKLSGVRQQIVRALNSASLRTRGYESPSDIGGKLTVFKNEDGLPQIGKTYREVSFGRNDDYIVQKLQVLLDIVVKAQECGVDVAWG